MVVVAGAVLTRSKAKGSVSNNQNTFPIEYKFWCSDSALSFRNGITLCLSPSAIAIGQTSVVSMHWHG